MSKEELREELKFAKYEYSRLVDMAKRMGNKNWRENFMIKDKIAQIKELETKLGE